MATIDLKQITDKKELVRVIDDATPLTDVSSNALLSTALLVGELQSFSEKQAFLSHFIPSCLALLAPGIGVPPVFIQNYLYDLVIAGEAAAVSVSCSSILAGQGSESDDTGDIAVWLGKGQFGPGHAANVLERLGLSDWGALGETSEVQLTSPDSLPSAVQESTIQTRNLSSLLSRLTHKHCFRTSSPVTGGIVVFFLIGNVVEGGWGGLIGIGTWSPI